MRKRQATKLERGCKCRQKLLLLWWRDGWFGASGCFGSFFPFHRAKLYVRDSNYWLYAFCSSIGVSPSHPYEYACCAQNHFPWVEVSWRGSSSRGASHFRLQRGRLFFWPIQGYAKKTFTDMVCVKMDSIQKTSRSGKYPNLRVRRGYLYEIEFIE